jgi:hypothetical protein
VLVNANVVSLKKFKEPFSFKEWFILSKKKYTLTVITLVCIQVKTTFKMIKICVEKLLTIHTNTRKSSV